MNNYVVTFRTTDGMEHTVNVSAITSDNAGYAVIDEWQDYVEIISITLYNSPES